MDLCPSWLAPASSAAHRRSGVALVSLVSPRSRFNKAICPWDNWSNNRIVRSS